MLTSLPSYALSDINDPLLIAIPMLIIAGELLSAVGAMDPLIALLDRTIGRYQGSLGIGAVLTSLFFAGSTGSSSAEAAAVASASPGTAAPLLSPRPGARAWPDGAA